MPGTEGKPPSKEELSELRQRAIARLEEEGGDSFLKEDMERFRNTDGYVARFWMHVFDLPGSQMEEAVASVLKSFKWRKKFGVDKLEEQSLNRDLLNQGFLFSHGRDKDGKKLMVFSLRNRTKGEQAEDAKKILIYWFERLEREEQGGMISWVFDCKGAGLKNMDIDIINYIIEVMTHYYPWILNFIYIFEMPWLMNAGFKVIKQALPAAGAAKLRDVTKNTFDKFVDDENRLECWGGSDDWEYKFEPEVRINGALKDSSFTSSEENQYEELPPQGMSRSISSTPSQMSSTASLDSINMSREESGLLRVTPSPDIPFRPSTRPGELVGSVVMTNISDKTVAYKLKTTSPDMFKVKPSTGSIGTGQSVQVDIGVTQSANLSREKFLIAAITVDTTSPQHRILQAVLKKKRPEAEYRLRCVLGDGSNGPQVPALRGGGLVSGGGTVGGNAALDEVKTEAAKLMKKMNIIAERTEVLETQSQYTTYGLAILLAINLLVLLILIFSSCPSCPVTVKEEL